jgi:hypothetical protein
MKRIYLACLSLCLTSTFLLSQPNPVALVNQRALVSLLADGVWPSIIVAESIYSLIPIVIGLIIEWVVLRYTFNLSWTKAAWVDVAMNAASAAVGYVFIPLAGMVVGFGISYKFNIVVWYFIAVLMSTAIEASVVKWLFKIPLHHTQLVILLGANGLTAGIAFVSLLITFHGLPS